MVLFHNRHHELWALWQFTVAEEDLHLLVTADECVSQMVVTLEKLQLVKVYISLVKLNIAQSL